MARILGQINTGGGRVLGQVQPTPAPIQQPTKQGGFFGGFKKFGSALIKSERGLGESIAGAIQPFTKSQKTIEETRKRKYEREMEIMKLIREKRQKGEDTSKLISFLKETSKPEITPEEFSPAITKTPKQILGESAGVLTDVLSAGVFGKAGKMALAPKTFVGGALKGAGVGALSGGGFGTAQGVSRAMQEDLSGKQIAGRGALGGLIGGVAGGVLGGITGGASGYLRGKTEASKNFTKELVSPKMTTKVKAQAIKEGRLQDPTFLDKAKITPSGREDKLANAVDDVVSSKASVGQNVDAIRLKITNTNTGVKNYVSSNKVPFNTNQLNSKLVSAKGDLNLIFASDKQAEKTFNAVVKEFMKGMKNKDTAGLFSRRQSFDRLPAIKKLLETDRLGENARREIVLAVRKSANEYIANLLPKGNPYKTNLLNEHYMLEALSNIAESNTSLIGKSKLQMIVNEYPVLKWVVGGLVGGASVGVGGAFISSLD